MKDKSFAGNLAALFTIVIWGTTFISTKVLLIDFQPVEILFFRFVLGFLALVLVCPQRLKGVSRGQEAVFALAGLCGVSLYFLLENIALTFTMASNVGVIISVAPFFTAMLSRGLGRGKSYKDAGEKLGAGFFAGFAVAMAGIAMISFNGSELSLNPAGDILAVLAAIVWACYSLLTKKIGSFGYPVILTTRRTFFYGLLFMLPALFFMDFHPQLSALTVPANLFGILYLGLGAGAACFVTWNLAVKLLGPVKTSVYTYLAPVITIAASVLILHEPITPLAALGAALTLAGLLLSQGKDLLKKERAK